MSVVLMLQSLTLTSKKDLRSSFFLSFSLLQSVELRFEY